MTADVIAIEPYLPLYVEGLRMYREGGLPRGSLPGWAPVDELYSVAPGQWTVVTGTPGSGKSEWLDAMLVNIAEREPWIFAVYSPENCPTATHLIKLVEKRMRKPFGDGINKRMSEAEYAQGALWVMERFFWLSPELKTPDELITTALAYQRKGCKFGIVLDPWNTLEHKRGGMSETDYVSFILTEVTKLCRLANAHVWLVVHPAKMLRNKDGTRPVPTPYDISGSAHWYNKADNIVTVHRDQTDPRSQDVELHVQKIRFKHCGHPGLATLKYDKITGRYFHVGQSMAGDLYMDPERGDTPPPAVSVSERQPGEEG